MILYLIAALIIALPIVVVEFSSFTLDEETTTILYSEDDEQSGSTSGLSETGEESETTVSDTGNGGTQEETVELNDENIDVSASDITAMADELINGVSK